MNEQNVNESAATETSEATVTEATSEATVTEAAPVKRGRGRPRKERPESTEPKRGRGRPLDPSSKIGQARALYNAAEDKSRANIVKLLTDSIPGVTKETAGAYYHTISKA